MPIVTYSVLRLGLFAACLGLLFMAGLGGWLLVVVAAFAAWGVSYVVLAGPRDAAALVLAERAGRRAASGQRFSRSVEADAAHEDAIVDAAAAEDAVARSEAVDVEPAEVEAVDVEPAGVEPERP